MFAWTPAMCIFVIGFSEQRSKQRRMPLRFWDLDLVLARSVFVPYMHHFKATHLRHRLFGGVLSVPVHRRLAVTSCSFVARPQQ